MSAMIQIRNVPDALHRKLKSLGVVGSTRAGRGFGELEE